MKNLLKKFFVADCFANKHNIRFYNPETILKKEKYATYNYGA